MLRVFLLSRDLSMILCDPFASNTLVLSTVRNLQELLSQDALPRVRHSMLSFVALYIFVSLSIFCRCYVETYCHY